MKATYLIERLHQAREMLDEEQRRHFDYCYTHQNEIKIVRYYNPDALGALLAELLIEAEREITTEEAKKGGRLDALKAAERLIKRAKADTYRTALHGAWIDSDGLQCICDGYNGYRLREHLTLEKLPDNVEPIDLKRIVTPNQGERLTLPSAAELRAYIKTEKARLKAKKDKSIVIYDFGEGLPAVNAEYLLTALEILPGCTATASKQYPTKRAIYFESEAGTGCVCPIRKEV